MRSKIISVILVLSMLFSLMGTMVYAEGDPTLTVGSEYKLTQLETNLEFIPPESDFYFIYSTGEESTYGQIKNNDTGEYLIYDNSSGIGQNFRLAIYLEEGTSYTVYARIYENPSEFDVGVIAIPAVPEGSVSENTVHTVTDNWDFLTFVPSNDGTYRFSSVEEESYDSEFWGEIYNSDFELISDLNYDIYSPNNFNVEADLKAGETYYLYTYYTYDEYDTSIVPYGVKISEISPVTSLKIVPTDGTVAGIEEDLHCELIIGPESHKSQEIEWYIEPERVGRIEYSGDWGASIELRSPGVARVTAVTYSNGMTVSDSYIVTCEGELPNLETGVTVTDSMYDYEIRSYYFTAEEEGYYGILSRGDLDLQCTIYKDGKVDPNKTEGRKGAGDNFNLQFYNLDPGTTYIVEVRFENPDIYESVFGDFEIMAYKATDEVQGLQLSVGSEYTVYTDVDYYEFNVSLLPETANQSALEWVNWELTGDDIGMRTLYGRNYVWYNFYEEGTATLTAYISEDYAGRFVYDSSIITCESPGYSDIQLDEVKVVDVDGHYSEGWFKFVPEEDGNYTVYSTGNADVDVYLDLDGQRYSYDYDTGYYYNFLCTVYLSAGDELYIESTVYNANEAEQYFVSVCKEYYADSVTIVPDERNVYEVGQTASFYAMMGNGGATYYDHGLLQWSVLDQDIAHITGGYNDEFLIEFVSEGITSVDVVTAEGYHSSITIYVGVEPPAEEPMPGDLDGDGRLSSSDSNLIRREIVTSVLTGEYSPEADFNGDGKVTALDSLLLKKTLAGLI